MQYGAERFGIDSFATLGVIGVADPFAKPKIFVAFFKDPRLPYLGFGAFQVR